MPSRVVSIASLTLVMASIVAFLACAWSIMTGAMGAGDGAMALGGWLVTGIFFAYRFFDPKWLDPISIVKSR